MPQPPPDEQESRRSVLQLITERSGVPSKVMLTDLGSEHGASPLIDPGSAAAKLVPQGRAKYQLAGEIARGGMGVILKGHDTDLGRDVAFKVLDKALAKNPTIVQRFVEEAQIGGQLQHPGIVPVYELGLMADESPYFTMKLVKGRTLAALFQQRKVASDNRGRLLAIFESVCQTMAYAHSKGVLHRDLKPANIMVGAFGEVQVVDWGLAKVLQRGGVADERRAKQSLHTVIETVRSGPGTSGSDSIVGSVMGTPAYMAPEQAQGDLELLDERADVFSLGAILCELLTGWPPYVAVEGETVLVQAARAKLAPARARIEACEADPALIRLCLDCLMPAREARPLNAEEVAKSVHGYLASVEERAQKAELAAAEARIKAAEERRARRLTVALAGVIVVAIALGGASYYWLSHERAKRSEERALRVEQTRSVVEAAQGESIEFERAGKPEEALAAARRALVLAESGNAEVSLLARSRNFVARAELGVGAAERERKLADQDEQLRSFLINFGLDMVGFDERSQFEVDLDAAFTKAFRDYGVDVDGEDLVPALQRMRERKIAEDVASALDVWGVLRAKLYGASSKQSENLLILAKDLDPDPTRLRMRDAIAAGDIDQMLELTTPENLPRLEPGSILALCGGLMRWEGTRDEIYLILDRSVRLYPGDYLLQAVAGVFYQRVGRFRDARTCRAAALALRPRDEGAREKLAESLYGLGCMAEAMSTLRICVANDPSNAGAHYFMGLTQVILGDRSGALVSMTRALQLRDDRNWRSDLYAIQFTNGVLGREELVKRMRADLFASNLATYVWALLEHPDPKQRDPRLVLQTLEERAATLSGLAWPLVVEAVARVRLEDWAGAQAILEGYYALPGTMLMTPMCYDFMRSLVCSHLGRDAEARSHYERGLSLLDEVTQSDPAAWEHSDAIRWRRDAEAALAK